VATSAADDASYMALDDLAAVLAPYPGTRVVGGHMVALLAAAFPSPNLVVRRTNDADAGLPIELAATGAIHEVLIANGYVATSGNSYTRSRASLPSLTIDLLVPAFSGTFGSVEVGERAFDASPGLALVVDNENGIDMSASMTLRDGEELQVAVTVPTLEAAFVVKAYAWRDRHPLTIKDAIDLFNLLAILDHHGGDAVGGWKLSTPQASGTRREAQQIAAQAASWADSGRLSKASGVDARLFAVLLRKHVARADT
jgi:predicted nucleotidyltransferase